MARKKKEQPEQATSTAPKKRPPWRPRIVETPEEFDRLTREYLTLCDAEGKPPLLSELALFLGYSSRGHMLEACSGEGEERKAFSVAYARAKTACESRLSRGGFANPKTARLTEFLLKAAHGMRDQDPKDGAGPGVQVTVIVHRNGDSGQAGEVIEVSTAQPIPLPDRPPCVIVDGRIPGSDPEKALEPAVKPTPRRGRGRPKGAKDSQSKPR